ncbi:CRE_HP_G0116000.mRNA.1.CDS.1 [Saccharomyces cerevisiae]|nr:Cct8p [Saccharomyces cerevisiae YJM1460]CAI5067098.1 CRE_HP_G0116000.mRNA.1.CDS.1 [Saccharomyces cerevisiae]CAI6963071.1 CRE_HP_G0116000.mRNA.1.CDS.1 [Saccharomyces cerevisiae]CAI7363372.1 CGH_1_collapsed_G0030040.mRNA.1.CDS.1 [Saccharomyces cerevisiae]
MSLRLPQNPNAGLFKQGYNSYSNADGQIIKSIAAIRELHQMCLTSMGPCGRNKIIVNHLGKIIITNDAATMLRELDIVHPAVKVLVMATEQQKIDMGDGTNLVMILAGELLNVSEKLISMGLSAVEIIQGYNMARKFTLKELDGMVVGEITDKNDKNELLKMIKPVISSKKYGSEDILSELVSEAVSHVLPVAQQAGEIPYFNVDSIRVVKIMGGSLSNSTVIKGMVFNREPEGHVKSLSEDKKHKVAVFTCPLDIANTETKGTVLLHNAQEMLDFSKGEEKQIDAMMKEIADMGVECIVAGAGVGELALHYLNRYGILVLKVPSKFELRRLCRVCGATPLPRLGAPTPEELGLVETVKTMEIGGDRVTVFKQEQGEISRTSTIILRGATQNNLDDIERAIDDGVAAVKGLMKPSGGKLLPGAGATEIELISRITKYGERTPGLLQLAIKQFAVAFEVVPRTLAETAGLDVNEVLPNLYAAHNVTEPGAVKTDHLYKGVDIDGESDEGVKDIREENIYDMLATKKFAINVATEAATTVLSIDQIIMAKKAGGPRAPQGPRPGNWDQED